jgi:protein-S-isoprenylcysteine O-methyltransferase Ste14
VTQTGVVSPRVARLLALGGLLFFLDSLLYFFYRYVVVFGRETEGPLRYRTLIADVVLFSVFALHHSLFARDAFRKWITRLVGSLERSVYVWIASALFIAVCALWRPVAGVAWRVDQPALAWCIVAGQIVGIWLSLRSASLIDIRELSGVKQLDTDARRVQQDPPSVPPIDFKTRGPYGWVRHPIYSGWFLIVFAVPVMTMTRLVFAITSSVYLLIAIPFEERSLRHSSGGAYEQYMRKVPWRLVPRLF